jgi:hypothetical protein
MRIGEPGVQIECGDRGSADQQFAERDIGIRCICGSTFVQHRVHQCVLAHFGLDVAAQLS